MAGESYLFAGDEARPLWQLWVTARFAIYHPIAPRPTDIGRHSFPRLLAEWSRPW